MSRRVLLALEIVVVVLAALQMGEVATAMWARLTYPGDFEWMEGATLVSAMRVRDGLPLYSTPSPDWIPFIYPPLHAWILGALAQVVPLGYSMGRAVSIVSFVASCGALAYAARQEGARSALVVGCIGLFVGTYENSGTFFDLVRTDSLSMALLGWSLALGAGLSRRSHIASGLVLALAFMSKQHVAMFGLVMAPALAVRFGWRRGLEFGLAAALPALLFVVAMNVVSDGMFFRFLIEVPATHGMVSERLFPGAQLEVWKSAPITLTAGLVAGLWIWRRGYWSAVSAMALLVVSLMRGHTGGYLNVLIPMMWVVSLWPALTMRQLRWAWAPHVGLALVAAQLWQGRADLKKYQPQPGDVAELAKLIDELRALPEPLLMPHAPYYPVLAGKKPSFGLITLWDIDHDGGPFRSGVKRIREAITDHYWASIVLPDDKMGFGLKDAYQRDHLFHSRPVATKTGWPVKIRSVWVPRDQ